MNLLYNDSDEEEELNKMMQDMEAQVVEDNFKSFESTKMEEIP